MDAPNAPRSIATRKGVHAATKFFAWRALDLLGGPTGLRNYTQRRSILNANDESEPEWVVHVWGSHVQPATNGEQVTFPQTVGQIDASPLRTFPAQVEIAFTTGGVRRAVLLDASGDIIYNLPRAQALDVAVMLPPSSAPALGSVELTNLGNGNVLTQVPGSGGLGAVAGQILGGRINVAAWPLVMHETCPPIDLSYVDPYLHPVVLASARKTWSPTRGQERSRNRKTDVIDIAVGSTLTVPVPAGANMMTLYQAPTVNTGAAGTVAARWLAFDTGVVATMLPLGDLPPTSAGFQNRTRLPVPGLATHLAIGVTVAITRCTLVWEID